jgi:3-isopropylmalate/(R)-2-methylmalate dehydratase large subunit
MTTLTFAPRVLSLSADPALVRAQLAGEALDLERAAPLHDDVSTDEISPLPAESFERSQFSRSLGPGLGVAGQPAHRGGERDRR